MKKNNFRVAIIGGGVAGIHMASSLNYFNVSNCIIETNEYLGGQPIQLYPNKPIHDFPGYTSILSQDIVNNLLEQLNSYNKTEIYLKTKINDITFENDLYVIKTNDMLIEAEFIIISTGIGLFLPNKLEINNVVYESNRIEYTVDANINKYKNKRIVVLGGGDSAIDWSNFFVENNISNDVSIIHRRNEYRSKSIGISKLETNKIKQYLDYEIVELNNNSIKVRHNLTKIERNIIFDFIIVQYGQKMNVFDIDLFNKIEKTKNMKIKTNQNQKTNVKNVFAIGACAYFDEKPNTILNACADGMTVAWYIGRGKIKEW